MSESTYKCQGSRVFGQGYSYNLTNKIDAERLCSTLNNYEQNLQLEQNISKQYDKITKEIIQIQLTLGILNDDINKIKETIQCLSK